MPCKHACMARRGERAKTFAELAIEPTWSETDAARQGKYAPRPGGVNPAGEFFDLQGRKLHLEQADATEREVQEAVDAGALVVAEACGCGGGGACAPQWLAADDLHALRGGQPPERTGKHGARTWLELWANDEGKVVYAHGDVSWGGRAIG